MTEHEEWSARSAELADYAGRNWVVTPESWVAVLPIDRQTNGAVCVERTGMIKPHIIERHFQATSVEHLIGLVAEAPIPSYSATMRSKWIVFTIEGMSGAFDRAQEFARHLSAGGLKPVIECYGSIVRILVYFDIDTTDAFEAVRHNRPLRLGLELARPFHGIEVDGIFLLPGLNHSGTGYSSFFHEGAWLRGSAGVDLLLRSASDPQVMPALWASMQRALQSPLGPSRSARVEQVAGAPGATAEDAAVDPALHGDPESTRVAASIQQGDAAPSSKSELTPPQQSVSGRWRRWADASPTWRRWEASYAPVLVIAIVAATWALVGSLSESVGEFPAIIFGALVGLPVCTVVVSVAARTLAGLVDRLRE